ncbi:MAG: thioesterase [Marinilabiliales bacterium]|nr:MAG: thioesterase [Marinilabiliales bacterium]
MIKYENNHRITYGDTDAMGVMYYANYLRVYEAARTEFMHMIGFSFQEMEEKGVVCPAINVNINYKQFSKFDWLVKVVTTVEELPMVKLVFKQEMFAPDGTLINSAIVTLGFIDQVRGRAIRCPEWILNLFKEKL